MTSVSDLHVVVSGATKRYSRAGHVSDIVALDNVSLEAHGGERIGVIGRNGSGKSTLLQLVAGVASPSEGDVAVRGRVSAVLTLGMGLREDLTGRESVEVDAALHGLPRERWHDVTNAVLDFAELAEFADRPVKTYSTGMKSRLAFAMLVTIEPEILLLDETLSVGDARFSRKATQRMHELCASGGLVILVSHALESVRALCDRCIWMDGGRIRRDGPAGEVIDAYAEEVRREDEQDSQAQFARGAGERSLVSGWRISAPQIAQRQRPCLPLLGSEPATVITQIEAPAGEAASLALDIVRLDGLKVLTCTYPVAPLEGVGARRIALETPRLGLGPGTFRATCSLRRSDELVAAATTIFEVEHPPRLTGGVPVLDAAWSVRQVCSERSDS